ncbi:PQQ-dependent sugar dehydrogenase [Aquimarina sp. RZ0]|uniref:PQQ-dependent sugar dehydrogenase n=1 Tax=Aquimarina sp. RZ0 TaxID=2607730 RepID=UPI0011F26429|nr:PQQ-dependent sugar dehydrogenase [Aquimarina sp. RZ0]KAA1247214.1 T9SS type A sorting domain-containing protein [Aquimarina sp. RZ0]
MTILTKTSIVFLILFSFFNEHIQAQITYESAFPNVGFEFPVEIQSPLDGTDRMFVVEQRGRIKVFPRKTDVTPAEVDTFLDITNRVRFFTGQELGLLGLAFHPDFDTNGYFYVYYTANSPVQGVSVRMVLSRFQVGSNNQVDPDSELVIFRFDKNQRNGNHNGGKIAFGPDDYLYISFGDGGGGNDPRRNAQNINNVFGSICRIDVDLDGSNPVETNPILPNGNYEIPSDNPFVGVDGLDEIFVYGIRNTWKFSFDNTTGRMWGADVGQNAFEEINLIENGKNYGWNRFEATSVANSNIVINEPTTFPVFSYNRLAGDVSITGGYVYRGSKITSLSPDINSKYIFGDYVSGRVWVLDYNPSTGDASRTLLFKTSGEFISSFGLDKDGELYFSDYGSDSRLFKLVDGTSSPSATAVDGIGEWSSLNQGVTMGTVQAVATDADGNVYHGGTFDQAGTIATNNIAVWNETSGWAALGTGANGSINTLKIAPNGNLYAGGSFTEIDGVRANNIAVWDGNSWQAVGSGIEGSILAMEIDTDGNVYVGGVFETINNGVTARNIAFWNGNQWSELSDATTSDAGTNNEIRSLAIDGDGILYVGGNFDEAGGNTANRIATWNGTNWGTLGDGTSGFVEAIATTPLDVYIGGNFALAGNTTVNRIARWNKSSSSWSTLGNGVNNNVTALIHDGTYLYAGGAFSTAGISSGNDIIVNNVARWSESDNWEAMGTDTNVGVDIKINAMSFAADSNATTTKIFAGGNFSEAGAGNANNTAQWISENTLSVTDTINSDNTGAVFYPNPTSGIINLSKEYEWVLINDLGQVVNTGNSSSIDLSKYAKGLYFLKAEKEGTTVKIIKE